MKTAAPLLTALAAAAIHAGIATAGPHLPQHVSGSFKASPKLVAVFEHRQLSSSAGTWKPGTPTLVSEQDAQKSLEQSFDHVFCMGVARFGHSGEWPDETFRVLDCSIEYNEKYCPGVRYAAFKGAKRFYFRLKVMRIGSCY